MRFRSPLPAIAAPLALAVTTPPLSGQAARRPMQVADAARDKDEGDVWQSNWAGTEHVRLMSSPTLESQPRFGPDGTWIAFVSARKSGDDDKTTGGQIRVLSRQGGEARRLTTRKGGAGNVQWSPGVDAAVAKGIADPARLGGGTK
jgi:dipeptidyl aminopeptidase/acylaminoacyl peptidase